jgi:hypothetical protein
MPRADKPAADKNVIGSGMGGMMTVIISLRHWTVRRKSFVNAA